MTDEHFIKGSEWADAHPNWHDADKELPSRDAEYDNGFSREVLVSDGERIHISRYDYYRAGWFVMGMEVTHWMYLPELPKED